MRSLKPLRIDQEVMKHIVPQTVSHTRGSRIRARRIRCFLQCVSYSAFIHVKIFETYFDCAGSQKLVGPNGRFSRLRSRCGDVHIFGLGGHLLWQARGKPRAKSNSWQVQEIGAI